jgi:hypothetical protein
MCISFCCLSQISSCFMVKGIDKFVFSFKKLKIKRNKIAGWCFLPVSLCWKAIHFSRWSRVNNWFILTDHLCLYMYIYFSLLVCRWNPCRVASKVLTSVIRSQFRRAWSSWGEIPGKRVDRMFIKFGVSLLHFLAKFIYLWNQMLINKTG